MAAPLLEGDAVAPLDPLGASSGNRSANEPGTARRAVWQPEPATRSAEPGNPLGASPANPPAAWQPAPKERSSGRPRRWRARAGPARRWKFAQNAPATPRSRLLMRTQSPCRRSFVSARRSREPPARPQAAPGTRATRSWRPPTGSKAVRPRLSQRPDLAPRRPEHPGPRWTSRSLAPARRGVARRRPHRGDHRGGRPGHEPRRRL